MSASNTRKILGVDYINRAHPTLGIEPLSLSDLLGRAPPRHFAQPQRPNFHLLILVVSGRGTHFLDFERIACRPGTLLHVRPGQVQQFGCDQGLQAAVLLFTPEFVLPETGISELPWSGALIDSVLPQGAGRLEERDLGRMQQTFDALDLEYRGTDGSLLSARTLQHLLHALLIQIIRYTRVLDAPQIKPSYYRTCRAFLKLLDARFIESRNVGDYAEALGCTVKTLRRACLATSGVPPKTLIEQRVVLEAKRLLAHTDLPVEAVAVSIGFTEPTNFVKFFRSHAAMLPSKFRASFPGIPSATRRR